MREVVITDGFRTPYVKAGTFLNDVSAADLGAAILKETVARTGVDGESIDEVIVGNAGMPADSANIGRVMALRAGIPRRIPAYTVQRNCASGMQAIANAWTAIKAGISDVVLVAGVESMSGFGFYTSNNLKNAYTAFSRAHNLTGKAEAILSLRLKDFAPVIGLNLGLTDPVSGLNMGQTAEVLAREFGITRQEQDQLALLSHRRWTAAQESGKFRNEIIPYYVPPEFDPVEEDVGPRRNQTREALAKLPPYFDKKNGTVTAGNSSPITDGGAAALIMSADRARALGYRPLGTIRAFAFAGLDPARMGLGPVFSTRKVLSATGMSMKDIELIELNEAFAAQVLACRKAAISREFFDAYMPGENPLGEIPEDITNVNGGAIAIGHPVGSSGLRIVLTLLKEMERRGLGTGLATMCIGGGQGGSIIVQRT